MLAQADPDLDDGPRTQKSATTRMCAVSREVRPIDELIRFVVAPTGEVRVVDYKTGRSPSERFEVKALFQMKFYGLVMWRRTGRVPDLLQLVYLKDGTIVRYEPDEADLLALERNVRAVWTAIEQAVATRDFRPSPSKLCGWCDFKPLCPAFGGTPPALPETIEIVTPEAEPPPSPAGS